MLWFAWFGGAVMERLDVRCGVASFIYKAGVRDLKHSRSNHFITSFYMKYVWKVHNLYPENTTPTRHLLQANLASMHLI